MKADLLVGVGDDPGADGIFVPTDDPAEEIGSLQNPVEGVSDDRGPAVLSSDVGFRFPNDRADLLIVQILGPIRRVKKRIATLTKPAPRVKKRSPGANIGRLVPGLPAFTREPPDYA